MGLKAVFVGGGSFRTLPIVRETMAQRRVFDDGEIRLVDLNLPRANAVARLIEQTPEYRRLHCRVSVTDKLDRALDGADVVSVSFPVGSAKVCRLSEDASFRHGFYGSDQLSLSGAFRSLTGGPILLDIARRMEKRCPNAWLIDFANPVAVYSGMVNNHTSIRALGVCGGFFNHRWDLTRLIFDKDELRNDYRVASAGVNHCAILLRGSIDGHDVYELLDRATSRKNWKPCRITSLPAAAANIQHGLQKMVEMRRRFGRVIFSTESDGLAHLFWEEMLTRRMSRHQPTSRSQLNQRLAAERKVRAMQDQELADYAGRPLDDAFWRTTGSTHAWFAPATSDATVAVLKALDGAGRQWLVASLPNRGAVRGFKDRTVLEYSLTLSPAGLTPDKDLEVPDVFHGLISSLATHQTLLGDAIATADPRLFDQALYAYPMNTQTAAGQKLIRELLKIHASEIPPVFQRA